MSARLLVHLEPSLQDQHVSSTNSTLLYSYLAAIPSNTQNNQVQRLLVILLRCPVSIQLVNQVRLLLGILHLCPVIVPLWNHQANQHRLRVRLLQRSLPFPRVPCRRQIQVLNPHQLHLVSHRGILSTSAWSKMNSEATESCFLSRQTPKLQPHPLPFSRIRLQ